MGAKASNLLLQDLILLQKECFVELSWRVCCLYAPAAFGARQYSSFVASHLRRPGRALLVCSTIVTVAILAPPGKGHDSGDPVAGRLWGTPEAAAAGALIGYSASLINVLLVAAGHCCAAGCRPAVCCRLSYYLSFASKFNKQESMYSLMYDNAQVEALLLRGG